MNAQAVGFDEESPDEAAQNKQQKEAGRDSNGLSPGLFHKRFDYFVTCFVGPEYQRNLNGQRSKYKKSSVRNSMFSTRSY